MVKVCSLPRRLGDETSSDPSVTLVDPLVVHRVENLQTLCKNCHQNLKKKQLSSAPIPQMQANQKSPS